MTGIPAQKSGDRERLARSSRMPESPSVPKPKGRGKATHHKKLESTCSSVLSWADPAELAQLFDLFTTPPSSTKELPSPDNTFRGWSFDCDRTLDHRRPEVDHFPTTLSPRSRESSSHSVEQASMPPKAQRLMGIDSPVYQRSTFDEWEDKEELQSHVHSSPLARRPKGDSLPFFFRSPPKGKSESPQVVGAARFPRQGDERLVGSPAQAASRESPSSKWTTLSQRFRSSSTSPMAMRLKRTNSSPTSPSFNLAGRYDKENCAATLSSPTRTTSMIETPPMAPFCAPQSVQRGSWLTATRQGGDRSEWAEARASSRALYHASFASMRGAATASSPSPRLGPASDEQRRATPVQIIRSTPPLRFNPQRRPRAPFPPSEQLSMEEESTCRPSGQVPFLPPCPNKMQSPSRIMRPVPIAPPKDQPPPIRPRRPTESNIFENASASKEQVLTTPRNAAAIPPRRPPPSIPIPPLPARLALIEVQDGTSESEAVDCKGEGPGKNKGLMVALGMRTPSPLPNAQQPPSQKREERGSQATPLVSPQSIVFRGDEVVQQFEAVLSDVQRDIPSGDIRIEVVVGGVQLNTTMSLLCSADVDDCDEGLAGWLKREVAQREAGVSTTLAHTRPLQGRSSNKIINSDDDGCFASAFLDPVSSEEEELSEEEEQHLFAIHMSPLTSVQWRTDEGDKTPGSSNMLRLHPSIPLEAPLCLDSPLPRRAHARTPTNVSVDSDSNDSDDDGGGRRRMSATPDLVASGAHAFILTASSPPLCAPQSIVSLRVSICRDPQPYPSLFHLLQHDCLPAYFSQQSVPLADRMQALDRLRQESRWLGYHRLGEMCDEFRRGGMTL